MVVQWGMKTQFVLFFLAASVFGLCQTLFNKPADDSNRKPEFVQVEKEEGRPVVSIQEMVDPVKIVFASRYFRTPAGPYPPDGTHGYLQIKLDIESKEAIKVDSIVIPNWGTLLTKRTKVEPSKRNKISLSLDITMRRGAEGEDTSTGKMNDGVNEEQEHVFRKWVGPKASEAEVIEIYMRDIVLSYDKFDSESDSYNK